METGSACGPPSLAHCTGLSNWDRPRTKGSSSVWSSRSLDTVLLTLLLKNMGGQQLRTILGRWSVSVIYLEPRYGGFLDIQSTCQG